MRRWQTRLEGRFRAGLRLACSIRQWAIDEACLIEEIVRLDGRKEIRQLIFGSKKAHKMVKAWAPLEGDLPLGRRPSRTRPPPAWTRPCARSSAGASDACGIHLSRLEEGYIPRDYKGITSLGIRRGLHPPRLERGLHLPRLERVYISRD